MARRRRLPAVLEAQVLFRSDHTCCICRIKGKDVQIHHCDSNPENNRLDNLCVVCLDCHSRVTGPRGLGKRYSPTEVRLYKRDWERQVGLSRQVHREHVAHGKELISQIDLIVVDILSSADDLGRARRLLQMLYEIHLWRGEAAIEKNIVVGLQHLATMTGLSSPAAATLVIETTWQLCWHLVGPDRVPLSRIDETTMLGCIDATERAGIYNIWGAGDHKVTKAVSAHLLKFFSIALAYRSPRTAERVIRAWTAIADAIPATGQEEEHTSIGIDLIDASLDLRDTGPRFARHREAVDKLLPRFGIKSRAADVPTSV